MKFWFAMRTLTLARSKKATMYAKKAITTIHNRNLPDLLTVRRTGLTRHHDPHLHVVSFFLSPGKTKITEGRTFHDGLGPGKPDLGVEAFHQGEIPSARQQIAEFLQAVLAVHFRVSAADYVYRQPCGALLRRSPTPDRLPG